ncbi:MAG: hypothetical protein M0Z38_02575 [Deltaproteobacteria bacterium]|nr:hypothetical protein [Deltaproteobacteria bacterium]
MTRLSHLPWARQPRKGGGFKNRETSEVMEPIRLLCQRLHLRCERNNTGLARGLKNQGVMKLHTAGTWDLTVYVPDAGCVVMVECKLVGNDLEPEQAAWAKVYRACGLEMIVATSVHEFAAELEYIRRRRAKERVDELDANKRGESRVPRPEAVCALQGDGADPSAGPVPP